METLDYKFDHFKYKLNKFKENKLEILKKCFVWNVLNKEENIVVITIMKEC